MLRAVALLCVVGNALGGARLLPLRPRPDGRIVGGDTIDISQAPYQLSLQSAGSHECGAAVLSSDWALTAAHCVHGISPTYITFRAGSSTRESGGSIHQAVEIFVHEQYDSFTTDFDVAVVKVSDPFRFGTKVAPVKLPAEGTRPSEGTDAVVTGWGTTQEGGSLPLQLQAVTVPIVSNDHCNDAYGGGITDRMICAGLSSGGKDSCQGDSGGPLVVSGTQVGIVSWGYGCARPEYPGVYTNVGELRSWVAKNSGI